MSSKTAGTDTSATADSDRARQALVPVAITSLAVAAFLDLTRADSAGESFSMIALDLVVVATVYPLVVARGLRQGGAGGRALVMGILAVVLILPAFWSGLPMILGAAATLLGYAGRRAEHGSGRATAAFVLGTLGMVGYLALYLSDWIAHPEAFWWA